MSEKEQVKNEEVKAEESKVETPVEVKPEAQAAPVAEAKPETPEVKAEALQQPQAPQGEAANAEGFRSKNRGQNIIRSRKERFTKARDNRRQKPKHELDREVISIRRVTKVRAGAKRLRFSAFVVVGDRNGRVGVGLGRSLDTRSAIEKASKQAEKKMIRVPLRKGTIPHEVEHAKKSAHVLIKPAGPGTGVIAGSSVRAVLDLCGVHNVLTKILGANNPIENAKCAYEALATLKTKPITRRAGFTVTEGTKAPVVEAAKTEAKETKLEIKAEPKKEIKAKAAPKAKTVKKPAAKKTTKPKKK
jgi:small subunit ribosomal protein S5